jgi:flagellar hook-basal body complex protein FliE
MTIARMTSQSVAAAAQNISAQDVERQLRAMSSRAQGSQADAPQPDSGFFNLLQEGLKDVNSSVKASEQASVDMAAGRQVNLHETMLAVTKAELAFNLAVQMRNKMVEAYQEVMRMQV